jgi:NADH-quinone oxidoreductase subunit K
VISLWHFLAVGGVLFGLGLVGFLTRRNLITLFLCAELMLQGVVLNLLAFGRYHGTLTGQAFGLFIITVAACEAGLALALFLTMYRRAKSLDSGDWQSVREAGVAATADTQPLPAPPAELPPPTLPVPGRLPEPVDATAPETSRA